MSEASLSIGRQPVGAFSKRQRVKKMSLNIRIQWNAGTACVSECVLKTLACRGLRVGPSKMTIGDKLRRNLGRSLVGVPFHGLPISEVRDMLRRGNKPDVSLFTCSQSLKRLVCPAQASFSNHQHPVDQNGCCHCDCSCGLRVRKGKGT